MPFYFGAKGWIGVGLDEAADWAEVDAFVRRSYRLIAPKRLAKLAPAAPREARGCRPAEGPFDQ